MDNTTAKAIIEYETNHGTYVTQTHSELCPCKDCVEHKRYTNGFNGQMVTIRSVPLTKKHKSIASVSNNTAIDAINTVELDISNTTFEDIYIYDTHMVFDDTSNFKCMCVICVGHREECTCKVCGEEFKDREELYFHYTDNHNCNDR